MSIIARKSFFLAYYKVWLNPASLCIYYTFKNKDKAQIRMDVQAGLHIFVCIQLRFSRFEALIRVSSLAIFSA